ncbi:hypothetical protein HY212_02855 [Candidatus Pacearchaeota archaeon]|nr:hypothetical protein [Candidatus Pacearchaeota archaeon]
MFGLTKEEIKTLKSLKTPVKIQDFLDSLKINFEENGDTCISPRKVLRIKKCHCMEGAILAALALRVQGYKPLLVDLTSNSRDFDHVVAVFKKHRKWGAISKTNHAVLRYREPLYNSIRELAMSYFHEYFDNEGRKNLRSYSLPVDLSRFDKLGWMTTEDEVWYIPEYLGNVKHFPILNKNQIHSLRKADEIEIKAGKLVEWKSKNMKENL